ANHALEGSAEANEDLEPAGRVLAVHEAVDEVAVELVAEVDPEVADAEARANPLQPWRIAGRGSDAAGIEEPEHAKRLLEAIAVLDVHERERVADGFPEAIAVHRTDAANRELALERQRA